jgi:hypothetical protein
LGSDPFVLEYPDYQLALVGEVRYRTDEIFEAVSKSFDLLNTSPVLTDLETDADLPSGSSIDIEWATGTTADFTATSWHSLDEPLNADRYVRFRVKINNQDESSPAMLRDVSVEYSPYTQSRFDFAGGCGLVRSIGGPGELDAIALMLLMALPFLLNLSLRLSRFSKK